MKDQISSMKNVLADDVLSKDTKEGYLVALLIYHQVCKEMIRLLLDDAHFFIQLSIFPGEMTFPKKSIAMFGQILDELKSTASFDGKDNLSYFDQLWFAYIS